MYPRVYFVFHIYGVILFVKKEKKRIELNALHQHVLLFHRVFFIKIKKEKSVFFFKKKKA